MIRIDNISKTFNARSRNRNEVLKNISFELPSKGLVAIFGKSGSGKTTLLNIMGGVDKADNGNIYIAGTNTKGKADKIRNANIGFIFQNYYLEKGYTISEILRNQMLIAGFKDEKQIKERSEQVLKLVEMDRFKKKQGDALSGGQQQRVAIARAIIKGPDVIFADEPTGNLDAENTIKVMEILKEISKTKLVVLVTHEVALITKYADSYIEIVDGEIISDSAITETAYYDTDSSNIYIDEKDSRKFKDGDLDIRVFGNAPEKGDSIDIISENGSYYIRSSKNVTVLDGSGERKVIFKGADEGKNKDKKAVVPSFTKSTAKNNGRLFALKVMFGLFKKKTDGEKSSDIFKQIFISAMAVMMCFFAYYTFEVITLRADNKAIDKSSVYANLNTYPELRKLDETLYSSIDFFETQLKEGDFSYTNMASLSGIKVKYNAKSIHAGDTFDSIYGKAPGKKQVLISRALANEIKLNQKLDELKNDKAILTMIFEREYRISGITEGELPLVYMNQEDYINFLNVYQSVSLSDRNEVFLPEEYVSNSFSAEIRTADEEMKLSDNQTYIEINRNSLYKMMPDIMLADSVIAAANENLTTRTTDVYITDSKPLYVKQLKITRTVMTTDMIIYLNAPVVENIFVYMSPNIDALSANSIASSMPASKYYFEVSTDSGEQLAALGAKLSERGVGSVDIQALYDREHAELISEALTSVRIFIVIAALLYFIYYFIEKSGSIKNSKEYAIYRAIGVNKGNLLFKETITALISNILPFFAVFTLTAIIMAVSYSLMNISAAAFLWLAAGFFAASSLLMLGIALIPYLFVLYQTPAKILAKYDI